MAQERQEGARNRLRVEEARPHRLNLRLSQNERSAIRAAARKLKLAPAAFAAEAAVAAARGESDGETAPAHSAHTELDELIAARVELSRVGTNLNQIAHKLNADVHVRPEILHAALGEVVGAVRRVDSATAALHRENPEP